MQFKDTMLPDHPVIRAAFDLSYGQRMSRFGHLHDEYKEKLEQHLGRNQSGIQDALEQGKIDQAEFERRMRRASIDYKRQLKLMPDVIKTRLERQFALTNLMPAKTIAIHSKNSSPDLIAAAMAYAATTPAPDPEALSFHLSPAASGMICEMAYAGHGTSDPMEDIKKFSSAVKSLCLVIQASALEVNIDTIELYRRHNQPVRIDEKNLQNVLENFAIACGNDPAIDKIYLDTAHRFFGALGFDHAIEYKADGTKPRMIHLSAPEKLKRDHRLRGPSAN